jgi:hypothetical protein
VGVGVTMKGLEGTLRWPMPKVVADRPKVIEGRRLELDRRRCGETGAGDPGCTCDAQLVIFAVKLGRRATRLGVGGNWHTGGAQGGLPVAAAAARRFGGGGWDKNVYAGAAPGTPLKEMV